MTSLFFPVRSLIITLSGQKMYMYKYSNRAETSKSTTLWERTLRRRGCELSVNAEVK